MPLLSFVMLWSLFVPAGEHRHGHGLEGRAVASRRGAAAMVASLPAGCPAEDLAGGNARGVVADEEDSEDGDVFGFDWAEALPDVVEPSLDPTGAGCQIGCSGAPCYLIHLRC
ncbi:MAG: hypothetical protein P4L84_19390 [Isosphaeraceae bacterium]|nr:hypothetical protein [Isosphaeraceae bacterium]